MISNVILYRRHMGRVHQYIIIINGLNDPIKFLILQGSKRTTMNIVIVGAGPAGLYAAHRLLHVNKKMIRHIQVLEANPYAGGRTRMEPVFGHSVVTGAGVVRKNDRHLRRLCQQLHVPLRPFSSHVQYGAVNDTSSERSPTLAEWIQRLLTHRSEIKDSEDFRTNFIRILGKDAYRAFVETCGYTDYEKADIWDTLFDYGFQDNTSEQRLFSVDWNALIASLVTDLTKNDTRFHLALSTPVTSIEYRSQFILKTDTPYKWYVADRVIWATARPAWNVLLQSFLGDSAVWRNIARQVQGQPFLRAYARPISTDQEVAARTITTMTHLPVSNALQKILPYHPRGDSKGDEPFYMISYSDNQHARRSNHDLQDKGVGWLSRQTGGLRWKPEIHRFFWECGTHYFKPLDRRRWKDRDEFIRYAHHPFPGLFVVGELLSRNQGWTEGALESVQDVVHNFL